MSSGLLREEGCGYKTASQSLPGTREACYLKKGMNFLRG